MAEDKDEDKKEEAAPPKRSKTTLFIIIGVVVLLAAGGGGAFFYFKHAKTENKEELASDAAQSEEKLTPDGAGEEEPLQEGEEAMGAYFPLDPFVVNLTGGRYIRLQAQLEFTSRDIPKSFYQKIVPIRDEIITALTKKSADEVLSEKGKEGIKKQIQEIANNIVHKEEIKRVYFTQYIVN